MIVVESCRSAPHPAEIAPILVGDIFCHFLSPYLLLIHCRIRPFTASIKDRSVSIQSYRGAPISNFTVYFSSHFFTFKFANFQHYPFFFAYSNFLDIPHFLRILFLLGSHSQAFLSIFSHLSWILRLIRIGFRSELHHWRGPLGPNGPPMPPVQASRVWNNFLKALSTLSIHQPSHFSQCSPPIKS